MKPRNKNLTKWIGAVAIGVLTPLASAAPFANGGFEAGVFTPWSATGNAQIGGLPNTGSFAARFRGAVEPTGAISQAFDTIVGATYDLGFFVSLVEGNSNSSFSYSLDGVPTLAILPDPDIFAYSQFSDSFIADGNTALSFSFTAGASGQFGLDDITVTCRVGCGPASTVPEPGTLLLVGAALTVGAVARRRKQV